MLHCPKTVARTIVYSGVLLATGIGAALAADPTGDWKVADGVANIRVAQCNGNMCGVDAWEGQVYNAKDGQLYSSTIKPVGADQLEIQGCVLGFLCGGETWTRVGPPIPSSPANSMAKGAPKGPAGAPPKTTGSASPEPKASGQKQAAGQPADTVGDICLLGDVARFAH